MRIPKTLVLSVAATSILFPGSLSAQSKTSSFHALENQAEREIVRRQEDLAAAEKLVAQARKEASRKNYEHAYVHYLDALEKIPAGGATQKFRSQIIGEFSSTGVSYAEWLVQQGRYSDAEKVAKTVLLPQFNPSYRPAVQFLANLEQPDHFNKTVTPEFAAKREEVTKLLNEAAGYYASGRYDHAIARYEQVLNLDPYNSAARRGMEEVDKQKNNYYVNAYNQTRSQLLWQVSKAWERPVRRFKPTEYTDAGGLRNDIRGTEEMNAKLRQIIIPQVNIQDLTLPEAVDYLQQQSARFDNADPKRGINIFLKADTDMPSAPAPVEGELPAAEGFAPIPSGPALSDRRISLQLSNVPMAEALRYLASLVDLKVKVEPFAVSLVPLTESTEGLITKEYRVPPGFIPSTSADATSDPFVTPGRGEERSSGIRFDAKGFLESQGVQFPGDATAQYVPAGSRLVVRNTPSNVDLIDALVEAASGGKPTQVEIQAKFVEVNQNNLSELGFDWLLGPFALGGTGAYGAGGTQGYNQTPNAANYPFTAPGGELIGQNPVTGGLRSGSGVSPNAAVTLNSIDALLSGLSGGAAAQAPGIFGLAGVFTNPQFQVVIRALNQRKGVDLLSAPKVTTKSGRRAVIKLTREFPYPSRFAPPETPSSSSGTSVTSTPPAGTLISQGVVTPSTPEEFEVRNIGVTLEVEPVVGPDLYTIDLNLSPEVVEFDGFVNYGSPILGAIYTPLNVTSPIQSVVLTPNVVNQPIFSNRKVNTSVTVWDGQTVALGGLIREDVQKVQDKVPILGDIPLAGRLFRSNVDQKLKKNLIIFVSTKIVDAEGRPLRSDILEDEITEPLGLPDDLPPPEFQRVEYKGYRGK